MNTDRPLLHPLQHDGTSRRRRLLAALLPDSVSVDERDTSELLVYARDYARLLQYHDLNRRPSGDWAALIDGDVSVVAAMLLHRERASAYEHRFRQSLDQFERQIGKPEAAAALEDILLLLTELAQKLLYWQEHAVPEMSLAKQLARLIPSTTGDGFCRLLVYLRKASALNLLKEELPLDRFEATWPLVSPPRQFAPLVAGMPQHEEAVFQESFSLRQLFRKFYDTLSPVLAAAPIYLEDTLRKYPEHEPHLALFLAFVQLMAVPRAEINTLTQRHLDFYYRDVLQLKHLPAVHDQVHLVLELAHGFVSGLLETSDRFLDGKDENGKDILFAPREELVLTPAKLDPETGLRTLFFDKAPRAENPETHEILNVFAAPDADAADRQASDGKWIPLGSASDPAARMGFAIASPMFLLAEGEREIVLRFGLRELGEVLRTYSLSLVRSELERNVNIYFSAEKAWTQISDKEVFIDTETEELVYLLRISPQEDAVIAYHDGLVDQEPLRERLDTKHAVMLFLLDNYGLSVEGDFDLSMEGDLNAKIFNPNAFYLNGEIIFGAADYQSIFVSQANVIGISPNNNQRIWENVTSSLPATNSIPFDSAAGNLLAPVAQGTYGRYNNSTYRANGSLPAGFPIEPGPAGDDKLIWGVVEESKGLFDPEVTNYANGNIVEDTGNLYVAGTGVQAIAPNQATSFWKGIPNGETISLFEQTQAQYYRFGTRTFQLHARSTPLPPQLTGNTQTPIWANISSQIISYQLGSNQLYKEDDWVFSAVDLKLYQLINDQTNSLDRKTNAPPGTAVDQIWKGISAYSASATYAPDSLPFASQAGQIYQCKTGVTHASGPANTALRVPAGLVNGNPIRVWMAVEIYDAARAYDSGSFVRVTIAANEHFYYATAQVAAGDQPNGSVTGKWTALGNTGISSIGAAWDPGLNYGFRSIVLRNGTYYAASVSNQDRNPATLSVAENTLLWEPVSLSAHDSQQLYEPYSGVSFNAAFYFAGFRNQNIVPTLASVWQDQGNIGVYVAAQPYTKDQLLRNGTTQFFKCQADCVGISPQSGSSIWSAYTATIEEYDPHQNYAVGEVVLWKNIQYYVTQAPGRFAPSYDSSGGGIANQNSWTLLSSVNEFSSGTHYPAGSVVRFTQGVPQYFQAQAAVLDIHPGLGLMVWEEVPDTISAFQPNNLYAVGSYVSKDDTAAPEIYRASVPNQNRALDPNLMVWEENTTVIVPYPFTANVPLVGSYVVYQDRLFRLLVENPASEPGSNPLEWQATGHIRFHNPGVVWYAHMHVRDISGNVYRAKQDVPTTIPITDPAFWELVSGSYPYKYLVSPALQSLEIEVSVTGMRKLLLENDQGVLNPSKPFMPFGSQPNVNANFYIGSHEVFSKSLQSVTIDLEWGNLPSSFVSHYSKYVEAGGNSSPVIGNDFFKATVSLLQDYDWDGVPMEGEFPLFVKEGSSGISSDQRFVFDIRNFDRDPDLAPFLGASPQPKRGFMTFSLSQHFFHAAYPKILAQAALTDPPVPENLPNQPYTPLINSLTLSYTSSETLIFKDKTKGDLTDSVEQFFHLHPYGWTETVPVEESLDDGRGPLATNRLLPRYLAQAGDDQGRLLRQAGLDPVLRDAAGNLLIGIKELRAPQVLHLLCQVAEGSENPARNKRFISWSYLSRNRWKFFEPSQLLSDDTNGLLRPGIVKLLIPADATNDNTLLPAGPFWLRAAVTEHPDGVGLFYDLRLHAVKATFENNDNHLGRLSAPLGAKSLSKLFFRKATIKTIDQPFASFGGSLEEPDDAFYLRVSERLRHKQRAVTVFDYERLVLAQFPQVYQVKCVTHSESLHELTSSPANWSAYLHSQLLEGIEHRPGQVQIVVLPDLRNQNTPDPLRPRLSNNLRSEIEQYLQGLSSGFAQVRVQNPLFEEVKVHAVVTLLPGKDPGFYLAQLQEDLIRYLSPWRFDSDYDLPFGASLHISSVIDYMDELGYVDHVSEVWFQVVFRDAEGQEHVLTPRTEEAQGHTAASVLVSAAAHSLTLNLESAPC